MSGILNLSHFLITALSRLLGGEQQFNWLFIVVKSFFGVPVFFSLDVVGWISNLIQFLIRALLRLLADGESLHCS